MAKVYDYEAIVKTLMRAQEDWSSQGRVTRKTYTRLRKLMSQRVVDRMTGQLLGYQNPMSTMGAVAFLMDLPEWRKAMAWARRGDKERRDSELDKVAAGLAAATGHSEEKVRYLLEGQMRQVGL